MITSLESNIDYKSIQNKYDTKSLTETNGLNPDVRPQVLLVSAPSVVDEWHVASALYPPTEPLGLHYIAGNLLKNNISTKILNCTTLGYNVPQSVERIVKIQPRILGISCISSEASIIEILLKEVRKQLPETVIVMGNIHASTFHDYYLSGGIADIVVHGEGEGPMVHIAKTQSNGLDIEKLGSISGISYLDNDRELKRNPVTEVLDLEDLPFPAWHLDDMSLYTAPFYYNMPPKKTRIMHTSRGCPIGCNFCTLHDGRRVRYQSPAKVVAEMKLLIERYGATHFNILDPMFFAKKSRLFELCDLIIKEKINIKFGCECHVNFVHDELFKRLKEAGCETIFFGLESGDDQLLKNLGKRTTCDKAVEAVAITRKHGIKPVGFFILGCPGETEQLTRKTIDFACSLPLDMAVFSILSPYPGSALFDRLVLEDPNFDKFAWDGFVSTGILGKRPPVWNGAYSYDILAKYQALGHRRFHFRPKMILRHLWTLRLAGWREFSALVKVVWICIKPLFKLKIKQIPRVSNAVADVILRP